MVTMRRSLGGGGVLLVVIAAVSVHLAAANGERHGIDVAGMDRSVAPGDDFYRYANGTWMSRTEIPSDRRRWGVFEVLGEASLQRTHQILDRAASSSAPGTIERTVGDYYASVLDEAGIEARGLAPLGPALARVKAIDTRTALARVLGDDLRADVDPLNNTNFHTDRLFGLWVAPDVNDPSQERAVSAAGRARPARSRVLPGRLAEDGGHPGGVPTARRARARARGGDGTCAGARGRDRGT